MRAPCDREHEVSELCLLDAWPARADSDLRSHVASCGSCSDVVAVIVALADTEPAPAPTPRLIDPRLIWHRAQMQARHESVRRAARPVLLIEITAAAVVGLMLIVWAGNLTDAFGRGTDRVAAWGAQVAEIAQPIRNAFEPSSTASGDDPARPPMGYLVVGAVGLSLAVLGAAAGVSRLVDRSDEV